MRRELHLQVDKALIQEVVEIIQLAQPQNLENYIMEHKLYNDQLHLRFLYSGITLSDLISASKGKIQRDLIFTLIQSLLQQMSLINTSLYHIYTLQGGLDPRNLLICNWGEISKQPPKLFLPHPIVVLIINEKFLLNQNDEVELIKMQRESLSLHPRMKFSDESKATMNILTKIKKLILFCYQKLSPHEITKNIDNYSMNAKLYGLRIEYPQMNYLISNLQQNFTSFQQMKDILAENYGVKSRLNKTILEQSDDSLSNQSFVSFNKAESCLPHKRKNKFIQKRDNQQNKINKPNLSYEGNQENRAVSLKQGYVIEKGRRLISVDNIVYTKSKKEVKDIITSSFIQVDFILFKMNITSGYTKLYDENKNLIFQGKVKDCKPLGRCSFHDLIKEKGQWFTLFVEFDKISKVVNPLKLVYKTGMIQDVNF